MTHIICVVIPVFCSCVCDMLPKKHSSSSLIYQMDVCPKLCVISCMSIRGSSLKAMMALAVDSLWKWTCRRHHLKIDKNCKYYRTLPSTGLSHLMISLDAFTFVTIFNCSDLITRSSFELCNLTWAYGIFHYLYCGHLLLHLYVYVKYTFIVDARRRHKHPH